MPRRVPDGSAAERALDRAALPGSLRALRAGILAAEPSGPRGLGLLFPVGREPTRRRCGAAGAVAAAGGLRARRSFGALCHERARAAGRRRFSSLVGEAVLADEIWHGFHDTVAGTPARRATETRGS